MYINSTQPIDSVVLAGIPALSKTEPWHGVSSKYSFLSTAKVIEALGSEGIRPYSCKTSYTRMEDKRGYTKHMLRFRHSSTDRPIVGGVHPEIVLTNSHDRGSSFHIELGLFRLVCSNGLVVSSGVFDAFRVRHVGTDIDQVLGAVHSIIQQFPQVEDSVRRMQGVQLTDSQREHMAALAMGLRWEADKVPFEPARLLSTRRSVDQGTDLWSTYNVIQENLTQGTRSNYRHARATRAIKAIDSDLKINRGLWSLAEQQASQLGYPMAHA
jgi:hypothetical protein